MELDDLALPLANRWSAEQMQTQIETAKKELRKQIEVTFVARENLTSPRENEMSLLRDDNILETKIKSLSQKETRGGLPSRVRTFLNDVRNTANSDGLEVGRFLGYSSSLLHGISGVVSSLSGHELPEDLSMNFEEARSSIKGDSENDNLARSYLDLLEESLELNKACAKTVTMSEGDDETSDFISRERVEAHRSQLVDFIRRQLPIGIRPPLNKLPAFASRKLVPDAETFQW